MVAASIRLKALLRQRHWQTFSIFCREYDKAALRIDRELVGTAPSRPQFHRWLSGALTKLPHSHHCQVLEEMLPGWTAQQLFEFPDLDAGEPPPAKAPPNSKTVPAGQYAGVTAIFASRSEFAAQMPAEKLLDNARRIRAAGLSLNVICQTYSDKQWKCLIEEGARVEALFLQPGGTAIQAREVEENFGAGHLSALTELNIQTLQRMRSRLPEEFRGQVEIATYDETIRFNILLIDDDLCVTQPYLPDSRGVDSPTLVMQRQPSDVGLYPIFEHTFNSLWERRRSL